MITNKTLYKTISTQKEALKNFNPKIFEIPKYITENLKHIFKEYFIMYKFICNSAIFIFVTFFSTSLFAQSKKIISMESLLKEMIDRDEIARYPEQNFTQGQVSSRDQRSVAPNQDGWYANHDGSYFIRMEDNNGRKERVLLNEKGAGALVHVWTTVHSQKFSQGIIRFYFDGKTEPTIEGSYNDVFSGKALIDSEVFATVKGSFREHGKIFEGRNLKLPIPYQKGLKITYESFGNQKEVLYHIFNFRSYAKGTVVKTFSKQDIVKNKKLIKLVEEELFNPKSVTKNTIEIKKKAVTLSPNESVTLNITGKKAIRRLFIKLSDGNIDLNQVLRSTVLKIEFDEKQTVWVPVGDFFGTGYKISQYKSWFSEVDKNGNMLTKWVMPFQKSAKVTIHNYGKNPVIIDTFQAHYSSWKWDKRSLYFHGNWKLYHNFRTKRANGIDVNFNTISGKGVYIGDNVTLYNNVSVWWGEGDEKIYIDGEKFPSHFGTGTEDYYGHAWCSVVPFSSPFTAQPVALGNRSSGITVNSRWRSLDKIPFKKSLKFDMEIWHWASAIMDYASTTFWYGDKASSSHQDEKLGEKWVKIPVRTSDRIEGEALLNHVTGGGKPITETYLKNKHLYSAESQLLIENLKKGDSVEIDFFADKEQKGQLILGAIHGPDYGMIDLFINGKLVAKDINLYNKKNDVPVKHRLQKATFKKGKNNLKIKMKGKGANKKVGIDYLEIKETKKI